MMWSIRDFIVCVTLVGFVMFWFRFKDSKMSLYWHSNVTNEIVSVLPTPCGSVLSWAHILFSLVLGYVCVWQMYLKERKKISIKTWMFLSYILQLKLNKRLASKFLLCASQTAVAEDIVIKQHLLRQKIYQRCLVQVVHGSLLLSNDEAVHQV